MSAIAMGITGAISSIAGIGGAIGGAKIQADSQAQAAQIQADAEKQAAQYQLQGQQQALAQQAQQFEQQQTNIHPFLEAGQSALPAMQDMALHPQQFTQKDFQNNMDPAYQWDLQQGQQALQRSAAASGGLMSGGTLKDLTNYAQGQASNEYQNAYNRFTNNQNTQFGRLQSLSGIGQNALGLSAGASQNFANNVSKIDMTTGTGLSDLASGLGNSQAAAAIGQGNAWSQGLTGATGALGSGLTKTTGGIMGMGGMGQMSTGGAGAGNIAGSGGGLMGELAYV